MKVSFNLCLQCSKLHIQWSTLLLLLVQFPAPWDMKRSDYTAVEVNKIVMERKLNEVPETLQLAMLAELMRKEGLLSRLGVNDIISIVHYPKERNFV